MITRPSHGLSPPSSSTPATRLADAEDMLRAIRQGEIDALVIEGRGGDQVYTLHSAEEPYRTLVEQMQEGALVLTDRGDISYANTSFAALVGEPLEAIVGSRLDRFLPASERDDVEAWLRLGSGRCRSRLTAAGSRSIEVCLSLATTRSPAGARLNVIVNDLSDLFEAHTLRDLAQRESRTKDEFLAVFAHELRNPLGAISAAARVLKAQNATQAPSRAHDVIARQVDHMSHLINDLLDVERVVSGKLQLHRQPVDLEDAILQALATFTGDATLDRQISISTEPVWVTCDAVRFQQVITNIVGNAVKYTPRAGQIRVTLRAEHGDAVLSVEDTGFGISPALLPFVFDMYMQVDRTLDHAQNGLGIGLALVRRLVELHGGTVVASSDGEGHGSTFTVRLKQIAAPDHTVAPTSAEKRRAEQRRVLLIEDSAQARERLRMMLEVAGHLVYDASDLVRGLELVKTVRPDIGIIGIGPANLDRRRVARRIREDPHGRAMVLAALGPGVIRADGNGPLDDGFDFHLPEPVEAEHLARLFAGGAMRSPSARH